jgi:hypothetical protein
LPPRRSAPNGISSRTGQTPTKQRTSTRALSLVASMQPRPALQHLKWSRLLRVCTQPKPRATQHPPHTADSPTRVASGRWTPANVTEQLPWLLPWTFPRESSSFRILLPYRRIPATLIRRPEPPPRHAQESSVGCMSSKHGACFRPIPCFPDSVMPPLPVRLASPWEELEKGPPRAPVSPIYLLPLI